MNKLLTPLNTGAYKYLIILVFGVLATHIAAAQSGRMKDPVSFTLKNGMTLVVAENDGASKVFSGFTSEAQLGSMISKSGAQEVLNIMLSNNAAKLDSCISFNEKGGNVKADPAVFEKALQSLRLAIDKPVLTAEELSSAKATLIKSVMARDRYYDESINETSINQLTLEDVKILYGSLMVPSSCVLTVVGNIKVNQARSLAKKTFGSWTASAVAGITK